MQLPVVWGVGLFDMEIGVHATCRNSHAYHSETHTHAHIHTHTHTHTHTHCVFEYVVWEVAKSVFLLHAGMLLVWTSSRNCCVCAKGSTYSVTRRTSREAHTRGSGQRVGPVEGDARLSITHLHTV